LVRLKRVGCGGGRNTLYLARHGWDVIGIDMLSASVDKARSAAVGPAAPARFLQGDVTRLEDLDISDGYRLINDSGCYYGLAENQRDAYATGVTRVAAPEALLLMASSWPASRRSRHHRRDQRKRPAPPLSWVGTARQRRRSGQRDPAPYPRPIAIEGRSEQRSSPDPEVRTNPSRPIRQALDSRRNRTRSETVR
jgi:SAM-dependent methyltransferase